MPRKGSLRRNKSLNQPGPSGKKQGLAPVMITPPPPLDPEDTGGYVDPNSDYDKPKTVKFEDITKASYMIKTGIRETHCLRSHLSNIYRMEIYLKKELLQYTGSFKERGARYALMTLTPAQKRVGVIAASAGNHALGLAYHGMLLGIPVTVVCPKYAPLMKVAQCRTFRAKVILHGVSFDEAKEHALMMSQRDEILYINGFDHPSIIAGQGTIGLEILHELDDVDAIVVPVGGGGLIAGVALAVKTIRPEVRVIGVEAEECPSWTHSTMDDRPKVTPNRPSLADGLAVAHIGPNSFATSRKNIDEVITVSENFIALAILRLIEMEKTVVEGAGAVGVAALLQGKLDHLAGKKVVFILSGGNIDTTLLGRCLERGLAADCRLVRVSVVVSDRPGGIAELSKILAENGASIKDVYHERGWTQANVFGVKVTSVLEMRDYLHLKQVVDILKKRYEDVVSDVSKPLSHSSKLTIIDLESQSQDIFKTRSYEAGDTPSRHRCVSVSVVDSSKSEAGLHDTGAASAAVTSTTPGKGGSSAARGGRSGSVVKSEEASPDSSETA